MLLFDDRPHAPTILSFAPLGQVNTAYSTVIIDDKLLGTSCQALVGSRAAKAIRRNPLFLLNKKDFIYMLKHHIMMRIH